MKNHLPLVILLACAGVFAFGLIKLFKLRFEAGDVYPPYSSLRADPLGSMALYESLGKVPGISVRRDFSAANRLPEEPDTAYVHLAARPGEWDWLPDDLNTEVRAFLARGGRLVITYFPQTGPISRFETADDDQTNALKSAPTMAKATNNPTGGLREKKIEPNGKETGVSLNDDWNFHEGYKALEPDGLSYSPATVWRKADLELPSSLQWHSGLIFTNCGPEWRTIYTRGVYPVVIERQFGRGSVVIASDSYFVSNEAMLKDRHADLLAWLVGANRQIVFDEAHFGIIESPGVAGLMRKYHLQGLAAGLLLLAGLFIWKNATSLVPPHTDEPAQDFVAGKNAATGFVNLLRRNIPVRDVFGVCFAEWKKSAAPSGKFSAGRLQQAEALFKSEDSLAQKRRDPIAAYQRISETLGNRKSQL
ncbi:MAG TPA: DUF4350 domain-containing protein [Candidatus Angelobacter sp.]|nr:DUF4350 domain-containing protein [Candidatus Angelobacter sp.]